VNKHPSGYGASTPEDEGLSVEAYAGMGGGDYGGEFAGAFKLLDLTVVHHFGFSRYHIWTIPHVTGSHCLSTRRIW